MSNIVCAYCHIKGHHIKFCEELAEKNRRKQMRPTTDVQVHIPVVTVKKTRPAANIFIDLYSSEEEEEGEIVENHRSVFRPISPASSDSENKWNRSGIKGVVIPVQKNISRDSLSDTSDSEPYEPSLAIQEAINQLVSYSRKYAGMSWADIENLSDTE